VTVDIIAKVRRVYFVQKRKIQTIALASSEPSTAMCVGINRNPGCATILRRGSLKPGGG